MRSPFPGMNPYLEDPGLWVEVHVDLIASIRRALTPVLRPHYRVAVEQRTYLTVVPPSEEMVGRPDVLVVAPKNQQAIPSVGVAEPAIIAPSIGALPMPEKVIERYLEIRNVTTQEVVTMIEILSPANKRSGKGRREYEAKRLEVLASLTNLVEIDLLRSGEPLAMTVTGKDDYRVVVSRSKQRPRADVYLFGIRQPIPQIPIPLKPNEAEPILDLDHILHELYDQGGYDMAINYRQLPPAPEFSAVDMAWIKETIQASVGEV